MPGRRNLCDRDGRCCGPSASAVRSRVSPSHTDPLLGRSRPAAQCRKVLLPDPEGPITAVKVLRGKVRLMLSRAVTAPRPLP